MTWLNTIRTASLISILYTIYRVRALMPWKKEYENSSRALEWRPRVEQTGGAEVSSHQQKFWYWSVRVTEARILSSLGISCWKFSDQKWTWIYNGYRAPLVGLLHISKAPYTRARSILRWRRISSHCSIISKTRKSTRRTRPQEQRTLKSFCSSKILT